MRHTLPARRLGFFVLLLLATAGFTSVSIESSAQEVSAIAQAGTSIPGSYQPNGIDTINLQNGAVVLNIPILSYPQLGDKLKLSFSLKYSPTFWHFDPGPMGVNAYSTPSLIYTGSWSTSDPLNPTPVGVILTRDQSLLETNEELSYQCSQGGQSTCPPAQTGSEVAESRIFASVSSLITSDRAIHNFGISDSSQTFYTYIPTIDGSNFVPVGSGPQVPTIFFGPDGIKYTPVSGSGTSGLSGFNQTDPDGNTITMSASGWTDSIGRQIPGAYTGPGDGNPTRTTAGEPIPGVVTTDLSKCSSGTSAARIWTVPGLNSSSLTYTLCFTSVNAATAFAVSNSQPLVDSLFVTYPGGQGFGTYLLLTQLILPNNTSYTFSYDSYLELQSITLPTGGMIKYGWGTYAWANGVDVAHQQSRMVQTRTVTNTDGSNETWTYNYTVAPINSTPNGTPYATTVITDPNKNDEEHDFSNNAAYAPTETINYYSGTGASRSLLETVTQTSEQINSPILYPGSYNSLLPGPLMSKTVTWPGSNQVSLTTYTYTPPASGNITYYNFNANDGQAFGTHTFYAQTCYSCWITTFQPQSVSEYDYGTGQPGALLRTTTTTYQWQQSPAYKAANLLNLPYSTTVTDGSSKQLNKITYTYDEANGSPQGILGHLTTTATNNPDANTASHSVYNSLGMVTTTIDGNQNKTYTSAFQCSGLFPQTRITPYQSLTTVQETTSETFDCNTGKLMSVTDPNNVVIKYIYNDPLQRLTLIQKAVGTVAESWTSMSYPSMTLINISQDKVSKGDRLLQSSTQTDGFGRMTHQTTPDGATVDTSYDPVGRVATVSNPHFASPSATDGTTTYIYDAINRPLYEYHPDSSYLSWTYSGNVTQVYDETRRHWQNTSDALGRLKQVLEPDGTATITAVPTLETDYSYDSLNNLLSVVQHGGAGTPITRSFTYDSLSRLLCESNPENSQSPCPTSASAGLPTGITSYSYDPNGNISTKTDSRGVITKYTYDGLNRLLSKTYVSTSSSSATIVANTAPSSFVYDSTAIPYGIGRLAQEYTGPSTAMITARSINTYDPLGRVQNETQCATTAGCTNTPYGFQYMYDLDGNITYSTNGSATMGIGLTYAYDTAERLQTVSSTWSDANHPASLFGPPSAGTQYSPAGLIAASLGTQSGATQPIYVQAKAYDNRFRPIAETDEENPLVPTQATSSTGSITISGAEQSTNSQGTHGTGTISITGTEGTHTVCTTIRIGTRTQTICSNVADTGTLVVTIGSFQATATYASGATDASVAASLASALTGGSSPVTATSSGNAVTMTSIASGTAGNYTFSITNGADFSVSYSGMTQLTGGEPGGLVYDTGTVSVKIGSYTPSYTWTSNDTASSIASGLASAIALADSSIQTSVSGSTISLTSVPVGSSGNTPLGCSVSYNSSQFSSASFSAGCNGMSGGMNSAQSGSPSTGSISVNTAATTAISGSVTIGGQEGTDYLQSYDYGNVLIYVGNVTVGTTYGQSSTPQNLAAQLATNLNSYSNIKATVVDGSTINIVANLPLSQSGTLYGSASSSDLQMNGTSFTLNTVGPMIDDSGSVQVTINGVTTQPVTWSPGTTAQQITSNLLTAINLVDSGFLLATPGSNATTVNLTSTVIGSNTDWPIRIADADTSGITPPAYSFTAINMSGGAGGNSATIYSYSVPLGSGYDSNGNLLNVTDSVMGSWSYGYDNLNRLTLATANTGNYTGLNISGAVLGWQYDTFGNRTIQSSNTQALPSGSLQYSAANNNQASGIGLASNPTVPITTLQYDNAGNLTGQSNNPTNVYDAEGRLCAVNNSGTGGNTQYLYDAEGRRVAKGSVNGLSCGSSNGFSLTNQYLLGLSGEQVSELSGQGVWQHSNVYAVGKLLATYDMAGVHFQFLDLLGSRRVQANASIANPSGSVDETCQSLPFGDALSCSGPGTDATEHHFTGYQRDVESALDYANARYYASSMGRFFSPDPSGLFYANPLNPQSLNLYSYASNNPLRFTDPSGLTLCQYGTDGNGNPYYEEADDEKECTDNGGTVWEDEQSVTVTADSGDDGSLTNIQIAQSQVTQTMVRLDPNINSIAPSNIQPTIFNCPDASGKDPCKNAWVQANCVVNTPIKTAAEDTGVAVAGATVVGIIGSRGTGAVGIIKGVGEVIGHEAFSLVTLVGTALHVYYNTASALVEGCPHE